MGNLKPRRRRKCAKDLEAALTPKWSVAKFAKACGVSYQAVHNWISDREDPSAENKALIKKHFGIEWPEMRIKARKRYKRDAGEP